MTEERMMPSEVRRKVLEQHREIESILKELETGVKRLREGNEDRAKVKRAAYALRGILELHMAFEEREMFPAIEQADGFGPERVHHLEDDHNQQRANLDRIVDEIREANDDEDLARRVEKLAGMLREDIEHEEKDYVTEELLRDSIMPIDTFGG